MKFKLNTLKYLGILTSTFLLLLSCSNQHKTKNVEEAKPKVEKAVKKVSVLSIESPKTGEIFTLGDDILVNITLKETNLKLDSLVVNAEGVKKVLSIDNINYIWLTKDLKTGSNHLKVFAYSDGKKIDSYSIKLRFKSDIEPELFECKIVNTYPHDKNDYTQGLFFENGIMYEGTGQRGRSVLKKVDFESGQLIAQLNLPSQYFGEGITAFKDKIIQLTYTSNMGFVYDKNSFILLTTLQYPTQGWGITSDGKKLIMSDGTNIIHFLDPEYFNETGRIEVFDHKGPIESLNELEYINGLVYANIYQTEEIIAFDPETGKVMKRYDCSSIVPDAFKGDDDNVLNGIAYDKENDRYFLTGKRWPSLFEVRFVKKW